MIEKVGIKVGELVRLSNPKATPRHRVVDVRGRYVLIARDGDMGNVIKMGLARIKDVKLRAVNLPPRDKVLKTLRPNGWPVRLVQYAEGGFGVEEFIDEGDGVGYWDRDGQYYDDRGAAEAALDLWCAEMVKVPNWELQARYDEEHGTVNGYDPTIEMYRNEF